MLQRKHLCPFPKYIPRSTYASCLFNRKTHSMKLAVSMESTTRLINNQLLRARKLAFSRRRTFYTREEKKFADRITVFNLIYIYIRFDQPVFI